MTDLSNKKQVQNLDQIYITAQYTGTTAVFRYLFFFWSDKRKMS